MPSGGPVTLCGIELEHPVLNGSGTFDAIAAVETFGQSVVEPFPFAAYVSKTITLQARQGNPPPRLWEAAGGLINSIGLPNKGLDGFLAADLPRLAQLPVPLIVSVAGFATDEFVRLVEGVAASDAVAALELNVSCPNVKSGCVFGASVAETEALLGALRPLTDKPLIVKLTPHVDDPAEPAAAAERGGADAVSLVNTLRALALDPKTGAPFLGAGSGGLSGPALRVVALDMVARVAARVVIPVVGMGGVASGQDALDLLRAGATCVAVGTESFRDPAAGRRVAAELRALCEKTAAGGDAAEGAARITAG